MLHNHLCTHISQIKYQDVLLRRDLAQRVCTELAPPTPTPHAHASSTIPLSSPASKAAAAHPPASQPQAAPSSTQSSLSRSSSVDASSSSRSTSTSNASGSRTSSTTSVSTSTWQQKGVAPGHWSGRLSPAEVAQVNARAGTLFESGNVQQYLALMQQLDQQGLMTEVGRR